MRGGLLTGTGTYALEGAGSGAEEVATPYGVALISRRELSGTEVLHVARHEQGHARLSNHVPHRANVHALRHLGAGCAIGVTVCGAVDPDLPPGSLVVFDDLHFPSNRLSDGSLCTFHDSPGDTTRGHWIFDWPFSDVVRRALLGACCELEIPALDRGCYGHVDGPRFNSRSEVRSLASAGVAAISQTCGPEAVLCGELELPYGLLGYVTDYANGVTDEPTPVDELMRLIGASTETFATTLAAALPLAAVTDAAPAGTHIRF